MDTSRTEILIGESGAKTLEGKFVTIVGVGGVGGAVAHMLARAGIGKLRLIDFDKVAPSNINRQFTAFEDTVGALKVEVLQKDLKRINSNLKIEVFAQKLTADNVKSLITPCDMVVDAIDSVSDKISLICHCKESGIDIISAMGAGNRWDVPKFYLTDIFKTHDDGLAKVVRKKLREKGVESLDVVTCESKVQAKGEVVGSISYYPAMCGITISAIIVNKFLQKN